MLWRHRSGISQDSWPQRVYYISRIYYIIKAHQAHEPGSYFLFVYPPKTSVKFYLNHYIKSLCELCILCIISILFYLTRTHTHTYIHFMFSYKYMHWKCVYLKYLHGQAEVFLFVFLLFNKPKDVDFKTFIKVERIVLPAHYLGSVAISFLPFFLLFSSLFFVCVCAKALLLQWSVVKDPYLVSNQLWTNANTQLSMHASSTMPINK